MITEICNKTFNQCIIDYHKTDNINQPISNPYTDGSFEFLIYKKCWIDVVQWHLEDVIRSPKIEGAEVLSIKRRIDASNQERTDLVEFIDSYFLDKYKNIKTQGSATINTESPAWAIDRLSILAIKIYHMQVETERKDADERHKKQCVDKLQILLQQRIDLSQAIEQLLNDIEDGKKYMKVYKQMKMYNDPSLNPILYKTKQ